MVVARNYFVLLLLGLFAVGCAQTSLNNTLGQSALVVTTAANLVADECGNTEPGGPCLETSRITTEEKERIKRRLQTAVDLLRDADNLKREVKALRLAQEDAKADQTFQEVNYRLAQADLILANIADLLAARGIK